MCGIRRTQRNAFLKVAGFDRSLTEMHLAGATVLRGPMGFGKSSRLHRVKILRLSMDLPLVIEIVDAVGKVKAFLPVLDEMMKGGLVTLEKVRVVDYRADEENVIGAANPQR